MQPRRDDQQAFAPKRRARWGLLFCLVLGFGQLCFVRERRRPVPIKKDTRQGPVDKDVRIITSKIKNTQAAGELLDVLDTVVDKPVFNYIHLAAAYTKLGNLQKKNPLEPKEVQSSVLVRLQQRLQGMLMRKEVGIREMANILWAFASLFVSIRAVLKVVPELAEQIPGRAGDMKPQELANSLWAAAQLQHDAPVVLQIAATLVVQIQSKAGEMNAQGISNSLWSATQLQDAAPEVLTIVPALVAEIHQKAGDMDPQPLSNIMWAAAKLQDAAPEVQKIVPVLAAQIPLKAGSMIPQALSNNLWAMKDLADTSPAVRRAVLALVQKVQGKISGMNGQALSNAVEALVFLEESFPIPELPAIVQAAAARLNCILPRASGKGLVFDVPVVVWACGKSNVYDAGLFTAVAERFSSGRAVSSLPDWGVCALILGSSFE